MVLGLQGCSTVRLAYNQAPLVVDWYLNDYVDFNTVQKPTLKSALEQVHVWHRQTQLPAYIESLQKMQRQISEPLTPARACDFYEEIQEHVLNTLQGMVRLDQSATGANDLQKLANLDASQLAFMERKFSKSNLKYREDYLTGTPQQLREKRFEKSLERTEMLYGKLDERQQTMLQTRLGHHLAHDVEQAKIGCSQSNADARLDLAYVEPGLHAAMTAGGIQHHLQALLARAVACARECVQAAGLAPQAIDAVYLTGGSSALRPFQAALQAAFVGVPLVEGDLFGGVASGLAYSA